jgi:hypothetical protein
MGDTTISVPEDLADELYERKGRGESYADVIRRIMQQADAGEDAEDGPERAETPPQAPPDRTEPTPSEDLDTDDVSALVDAVADDVLPGSPAKLDARRDGLLAVVEYLRAEGQATPADFREDVYPDHTARYTDGEDPARSWWKNCMYPGLRAVAERSELVEKADTTGAWSWRGE